MPAPQFSDPVGRIEEKILRLKGLLKQIGPSLIAFSGGVDSSFLLAVAAEVYPSQIKALMTVSPATPPRDKEQALALAKRLNLQLLIIPHDELSVADYASNPLNRCYFCKNLLYEVCMREARQLGIKSIIDGVNLDDLQDYRPGLLSAHEYQVKHPLAEVEFSKREIRSASRMFKLPTWDRPASPCLSSRIPYGTAITKTMLARISDAESYLHSLGFDQVRVRYDGDDARIEFDSRYFHQFSFRDLVPKITKKFTTLGLSSVAIDLEGYKSGVFNPQAPPRSKSH